MGQKAGMNHRSALTAGAALSLTAFVPFFKIPKEPPYKALQREMNLKEVLFNERGVIVNYEEILSATTWFDNPSEEVICCESQRSYWAVLPEERAVIDMRYDFRWDEKRKDHVYENVRYSQFFGLVGVTQFSKCRSEFHRFHVCPICYENSETIFMVKDAPVRPPRIHGSPRGYACRPGGWFAGGRRGQEDNWWELELEYSRNPHDGKCWRKVPEDMQDISNQWKWEGIS